MTVTFKNEQLTVEAAPGMTVLEAAIAAGLRPDAPCGGKGTCGKCTVLIDGAPALACRTAVDRDMTVELPEKEQTQILTGGAAAQLRPDGTDRYALAFDVGTTTVVCYLLDGVSGRVLAQTSTLNPQTAYGADVISRIQYALKGGDEGRDEMAGCIRTAMALLAEEAAAEAGIALRDVTLASVVGNTAMHHLLLGIDPKPLTEPPYMPKVFDALELPARGLLPIAEDGTVRVLPNIAGFVGADTVGCLSATGFDRLTELTLMIDIGTNGEMVLGDGTRRIACSTAAGPAFEGAKISCGMRGAPGAVDHVWLENGAVRFHVIGGGEAKGLCGSGLLDLTAVLLDLGVIAGNGRMKCKSYRLGETEVVLTQKDVREVQLAKAAIRAGFEVLAVLMGRKTDEIRRVLLAGAFGNYLDPASACRIGLLPPCLIDRIGPVGNAAGEGAKQCALSAAEFGRSRRLAAETEFLELASLPQFQSRYIALLDFAEKT